MTTLSEFKKIKVHEINQAQGAYNYVMIIDDHEEDRLIFSQMIAKTGFAKKILDAESGSDAIEWLSSFGNKPDDTLPAFIFLDLLMPEMDGFGFLDAFGKFPTSIKSRCKIIVFTSSGDMNRKKSMKYKTVYDYFSKPLKTDYFIKILQEFKLLN